MVPQWLIEKKRNGEALTSDEIRFFINGFTSGDIPDYQMSAMAMAIYFRGMSIDETAELTDIMKHSGDVVDTSAILRPKVDKHSTGGIGDKVSLILAPLVATCDVAVPMISGRGLGITGGTLDKLESIPGYRTDLSVQEFVHTLDACGCCIIGQTGDLAPADKKLYALRDVTGTVPSIPLIVASILSKKLAEGIDSLVMDVKWGRGAFMQTEDEARDLARTLVEVGNRAGTPTAALITDMNEPLGRTAGNALEVRESIDCLEGNGAEDLMEVTLELGAAMLLLAGVSRDRETALDRLREKIANGEAADRFRTMVELQGGDTSALERADGLPRAGIQEAYLSPRGGTVSCVDADAIGRACLVLGAGRRQTTDEVDPAVGIADLVKVGSHVGAGDQLLMLHANDQDALSQARDYVERAFTFAEEPVAPTHRITDSIFPERTAT